MSNIPGSADTLLADWFGYKAVPEGDGLVVPDSDRALRAGPADIIEILPRISLLETPHSEVARKLAAAVPDDFDEYFKSAGSELPEDIKIPGGFGNASELYKVTTEVAISTKEHLPEVIDKSLIPFLVDKFNVTHVTPIFIKAIQQQQYFSLAKMALLHNRVSPEEAGELVNRDRVLGGIEMSGALDILNFVDALTRLAPVLFSIPIQRHGCVWHFTANAGKVLPVIGCRGMFQDFVTMLSPRYTKTNMFAHMSPLGEDSIWRLIRQTVFGVNRLMKYLNDPRTFVDGEGNVDWLKQIKAFGAIHLMFADLLSMNCSIEPHQKITVGFGFLDKLANMKNAFSAVERKEPDLFCELLSLDQGKELNRLYQEHIGNVHPDLASEMIDTADRSYKGFHEHLGDEDCTGRNTEAARLQRIRAFRNLSHGTFLRGDKFDHLFLQSEGTVPEEIAAIPFLLMHGLIASPKAFLEYAPVNGPEPG